MKNKFLPLLCLECLFLSVLLTLTNVKPVLPEWPWMLLMGLAVFSMARTISFREVAEPLRAPFCETRPDSCGAGANVHPKANATGLRYTIGAMLSCPICTGTWSTLFLYTLWLLLRPIGTTFIIVFGIAGIAELLHWLADLLEWSGRAARVVSGRLSPDKEEEPQQVTKTRLTGAQVTALIERYLREEVSRSENKPSFS